MSEHESEFTEVELAELWETLEKLERCSLSDTEGDALTALLDRSAEARSIYLEYFELVSMLKSASEVQAQEGRLPVFAEQGKQRKALHLSVLVAAAVVLLLAGIAALIHLRRPDRPVMLVEVAIGTEWTMHGGDQDSDLSANQFTKGATVRVYSGTAALTLESGVRLLIQGPAEVAFPELEKPVLKKGWLWVDSAAHLPGLQIETPGLEIRDVGTRFGVRVCRDRSTQIHLISGEVEARLKDNKTVIAMGPDAKSSKISLQGNVEETEPAIDPFPDLEELLIRPHSYATTILGQTPGGYWRLNDVEKGVMENAVPGGIPGDCQAAVKIGQAGVRPEDGFGGFEEGNQAYFLTGSHGSSVLQNLDVPGGVSPLEGGVSFWFRREGEPKQEEIMWYAGMDRASGLGPEEEIHVYLESEGRVRFFMENGRYDILLSSSRNAADGLWHHVAATWRNRKVELFLDGESVMVDHGQRTLSDTVFRGTQNRFGKPRVNHGGRQFLGWVDEIAYWNRMLMPVEVRSQYQAATSTPIPGSGSYQQKK